MSRLTVAAWKCDIPKCGWVWIAKGDVPPEKCAKCKNRAWHHVTTADKVHEIQHAIPALQPASAILSGPSRRVIDPSATSDSTCRPQIAPRCPNHRLPMTYNEETHIWACRVTKCRQRADDESVTLAYETADFASI